MVDDARGPFQNLQFEWDERKNGSNVAKHGIDFQRAALIFKDATLERVDDREDYGELRIVALGLVGLDVYRVVFTEVEDGVIRIVSAQRAERNERQIFFRETFP
jgi:uncharacterized DUF497 family protein